MGSFKLWYLYTLPGAISFLEIVKPTFEQFDLVTILVSLVCSMVGSSVQIVHKNMDRGIKPKEILAVYVTGIMVALMGYLLTEYTRKLFLTAFITVFASYMSLELFKAGKKASLYLIGKLPDTLLEGLMQYLNSKYESKNKDDEDIID